MTAAGDLRAEVLDRLRALTVAHPERTVHLTIDVVRYGAPLPVAGVLATLEHLRASGAIVHAGGGWRLPEAASALDGADGGGAVWLVVISGATVLSVHASQEGARARVAELDSFDAHVERRRLED